MPLDRYPGPVDSSSVKLACGGDGGGVTTYHSFSLVHWTQVHMCLPFHGFWCVGLERLGQELFTTRLVKSQSRHNIVGSTRKRFFGKNLIFKGEKLSTLSLWEKLRHLFYFELLMDEVSYSFFFFFYCLWPWNILIQLDFPPNLNPLAKSGTCFNSLTVCFLG